MSGQNILSILEKHESFSDLKAIFAKFHQKGYQIYLAGGCVRDALLGRKIHDFDMACSALPTEVKLLFSGQSLDHGIQFGTVTLVLNKKTYEVTSYRAETNYTDGRRPQSVNFSQSLEVDSQRRDFTINAIYADLEGRVIDPQSGVKDLEHRILKCVGGDTVEGAAERFQEDALRMYRGLRFIAELDFEFSTETFTALCENWSLTKNLSKERRYQEFKKMILAPYFKKTLPLILENNLLPLGKPILKEEEFDWQKRVFQAWSGDSRFLMFVFEWGRAQSQTFEDFLDFLKTINKELSFTKEERKALETLAQCLWQAGDSCVAMLMKLNKFLSFYDMKMFFLQDLNLLKHHYQAPFISQLQYVFQNYDQMPEALVKAGDLNLVGAKLGEALMKAYELQVLNHSLAQNKEQVLELYYKQSKS